MPEPIEESSDFSIFTPRYPHILNENPPKNGQIGRDYRINADSLATESTENSEKTAIIISQ